MSNELLAAARQRISTLEAQLAEERHLRDRTRALLAEALLSEPPMRVFYVFEAGAYTRTQALVVAADREEAKQMLVRQGVLAVGDEIVELNPATAPRGVIFALVQDWSGVDL